jgi:hypothetical protein
MAAVGAVMRWAAADSAVVLLGEDIAVAVVLLAEDIAAVEAIVVAA